MGYNMAGHLRRKMSPQDTLYVNDVNKDALSRFQAEMGTRYGPVKVVDTAQEAADDSKVVISIVPRAVNVKQVFLGDGGVIEARPDPERLLLECSTIDPKTTREVEAKLSSAGLGRYFDAPVSVSSSLSSPVLRAWQ
jgi:3-hydroxyisobutyrate dehydrogenase